MPLLKAYIQISGPESDFVLENLGGIVVYGSRSEARKAVQVLFSKISSKGYTKLQGGLGVKKNDTKAEIV